MKAIWGMLALTVAAFGLSAGVVLGLGDGSVFTSPPEAVVEDFVRGVVGGRYGPASSELSEDLQATTGPADLQALRQRLERRAGRVLDVRGEPGWARADSAEASALLQTKRAGRLELVFRLSRSQGSWSIEEIGAPF